MTADIVERLREARHNDHDRGCEGRMYTCTCGYDERIFAAAEEAAADIEKLRRENEELDFLLHEGGTWEQQLSAAESECARLRAELERTKALLLKCADILDANDFGHDVRFEAREAAALQPGDASQSGSGALAAREGAE